MKNHVLATGKDQWQVVYNDHVLPSIWPSKGEALAALNNLEVAGGRWPSEWKTNGWNNCLKTAPEALRFLANNERPVGGEERFNAEHLFQLADELEKTQKSFGAIIQE